MSARNACDSQRPISIILLVEWFAKNNPMAAPDWIDFVPMSILENPKVSFPPRVAQRRYIEVAVSGIRLRVVKSQGL